MDRRVVDLLRDLPERQRFFAGLRAWVGGRQTAVAYDRPSRAHGKSKVRIGGLFKLARVAIVSFSKTPLRVASAMAFGFSLLLFSIGLVATLIRLFTDLAVPGWATYTTLLGMMGSVQSLVLALLSEYVAVLYDEVKGRPLYLVHSEYHSGQRIADKSRS